MGFTDINIQETQLKTLFVEPDAPNTSETLQMHIDKIVHEHYLIFLREIFLLIGNTTQRGCMIADGNGKAYKMCILISDEEFRWV